jgi:hypothetical protein
MIKPNKASATPLNISKPISISSPSGRSISTSSENSHRLDSAAALATVFYDVAAFRVGHAFLKLHYLFANNATQQIDQGTFIVILRIFRHFFPSEPFSRPLFPLRLRLYRHA